MTVSSGIYRGAVVHERLRPRRHRLKYNVFSLLLDLDELESLSSRLKMLSYNRWGLYSIHDKDHGDSKNLRNWVRQELGENKLSDCCDKVFMLCYPRILGYVFNPLTVYFCYRKNGALGAIIYEVHNTYKERHSYVLAVGPIQNAIVKQRCAKDFYVSPFIPKNCTYNFKIHEPGDKVRVVIREEDADGLLLVAAFSGSYQPLSDYALVRTALRYPLMTLKVMAAIHVEAFKLFIKKMPYFAHHPIQSKTSSAANSRTFL